MDKQEVLRRLRVYYELPAEQRRPLSWKKLAEAAGETGSTLYQILLGKRALTDRMAKKVGHILELMEAGRICYIADPNAKYRKGRFLIADEDVPTPKMIRHTIAISRGGGAQLVADVVNPMSFPVAPKLFRRIA
jgi:transcriptional regulator with XRE-family HTH domain